jgi:hypothetical protein
MVVYNVYNHDDYYNVNHDDHNRAAFVGFILFLHSYRR